MDSSGSERAVGSATPVTGSGGHCAVLALGLDNLFLMGDLFGPEMQDVLVDAADLILKRTVPQVATISKTRHGRFILHLPTFDAAEVRELVSRIQATAAADPVDTPFGPVAITVSAGCAFASDMEDLAAQEPAALHALHSASSEGVGGFGIARDDKALIAYRSRLMQASQAVMGDQDLALAFQPIVRSDGGNLISFHECLVRIKKPEGGVITAAEFMPAIERLGLAPMIDRQVLVMTFEQLTKHPLARFSVNIFPHTMQDRQWMMLFENAVRSDPSLAERLIIEVTESAAILDLGRTRTFMDRLRDVGVSFALDDFGAGHTSLRYLRELRFDILKVDGQFVRDVNTEDDNAFLIETMVQIARRFDMMSVAEAVQTPAEARRLSDLGVEYFQGFQFGSPSLVLQPTATPMPEVAFQA